MISSLINQQIFSISSTILTLKSLLVKSTPRTKGNKPVFAMFITNYLRKNIAVYFSTAQNTRKMLTFFFFYFPFPYVAIEMSSHGSDFYITKTVFLYVTRCLFIVFNNNKLEGPFVNTTRIFHEEILKIFNHFDDDNLERQFTTIYTSFPSFKFFRALRIADMPKIIIFLILLLCLYKSCRYNRINLTTNDKTLAFDPNSWMYLFSICYINFKLKL